MIPSPDKTRWLVKSAPRSLPIGSHATPTRSLSGSPHRIESIGFRLNRLRRETLRPYNATNEPSSKELKGRSPDETYFECVAASRRHREKDIGHGCSRLQMHPNRRGTCDSRG